MLADDMVIHPPTLDQGRLRLTDTPGIGVKLDVDKVAKYAELYEKEATIINLRRVSEAAESGLEYVIEVNFLHRAELKTNFPAYNEIYRKFQTTIPCEDYCRRGFRWTAN